MKRNFLYQITAASRTLDQGGYRFQIPVLSVLSSTEFVDPTGTKFLGTPLHIRKCFSSTTDACSRKPTAPAPSTVT